LNRRVRRRSEAGMGFSFRLKGGRKLAGEVRPTYTNRLRLVKK
jgi:hypothetical protein